MKRFILISCAAIALFSLPMRAAVQPMPTEGKKAEVHFTGPVVIGTTTVPEGNYKVQCINIDGKDFLVVTSVRNGKEVVRVPCTPEMLKAKVDNSDYRTIATDGVQKLTSVRIKGETVAHVID